MKSIQWVTYGSSSLPYARGSCHWDMHPCRSSSLSAQLWKAHCTILLLLSASHLQCRKKKRSVPTTQALDKSAIRLLQCCRFCTGLMESCSRALHQAPSCPACTWALTWPSCQTKAKWIKGSDQGLAAGQPFSAGVPGEWKPSPLQSTFTAGFSQVLL